MSFCRIYQSMITSIPIILSYLSPPTISRGFVFIFNTFPFAMNPNEAADLADLHDSLIVAPRQKKLEKQHSKRRTNPKAKEQKQCTICKDLFTYEKFEHHKKSRKHKQAVKEQKRQSNNKPKTPEATPLSPHITPHFARLFTTDDAEDGPQETIPKEEVRETRYFTRTGYENLTEENKLYQYTLVALLAIEKSFDANISDVCISINDSQWNEFGDIVIELTDKNGSVDIYAIQLKQVTTKNDISYTALAGAKGPFSLQTQSKFLTKLRQKNKTGQAHFLLYTQSNLSRDVVKEWKSASREFKEIGLRFFRRKHIFNANPDNEDVFKVELLNQDDDVLLLTNQRSREALKSSIELILSTGFDTINLDIVDSFIKFIRAHFNKPSDFKFAYKLTRKEILLKVSELLLSTFMLFPEVAIDEEKSDDLWRETLGKFDVTIMKNHYDTINKIYGCINVNLNGKFAQALDTSTRHVHIFKKDILDETLKADLFNGFYESGVRTLTLNFLYVTLWKLNYAPLAVTTDNMKDLTAILKVVAFLKSSGLPLKFIVATNVKHKLHFPKDLEVFASLDDLNKDDSLFLEQILDRLDIPILNFRISLRSLSASNEGFLKSFTPDALLNLLLNDYSFRASYNPKNEDAFHNILAVDNDIINKVKKYFPSADDDDEPKNISYMVKLNGQVEEIDILPDLL